MELEYVYAGSWGVSNKIPDGTSIWGTGHNG
jgi:hypothetical protein